jgi:hypothetical protein
MVIRQKMTERTEAYALGPQECLGNQKIGRGTRLPCSGEVLADPCFLESQSVETLEFLEIPALAVGDGPLGRMRRHE